MTKSTDKQIRFALHLLDRAGFSTRYMDRHFAQLGAGMRQRSGTVEDWLRNMSSVECSRLIDTLKAKVG